MPTLRTQILLILEECAGVLLNPYMLMRFSTHYSQSSFYTTSYRMEKDGLIERFEKEGKKHIKLTARGKAIIERHRAGADKQRPDWDHKWRLVIFDVPEDKAELRKFLRSYLIALGFGKAQRSVWISPYDFRKEIRNYLRKLKLSDYVYQLRVDNFDGLTGAEIATTFWDLDLVHNKYMKFHQDWSERFIRLEEKMKEDAEPDPTIFKQYMKHLDWDYQSVLSRDPYLPLELLPPDWGGKAAGKLVTECQNKLNIF